MNTESHGRDVPKLLPLSSIFKIIDDVDFVAGVRANNSPCFNLARADFLAVMQ